MATALLRSNVEFAKRVFLDRLTVDAQPLNQVSNIDSGPGDAYLYGGVYDAADFGVGADCSGCAGIVIDCAVNGPTGASWQRLFSTETFPGPFGDLFIRTTQADLLSGNYPIKVCIHHGGGGPNSHMNAWIDGWLMESNGTSGTCTLNYGAIPQNSSYWNDFWVCKLPISENTQHTQPMGYPRGVDYAGGRIPAAQLSAAGISFVCRYLTSGGASLPGKQLDAGEFQDLMNHGIAVVFNYETTANFMLSDDGAADARQALDYIHSLPGAPAQPTVYFSADFDESPAQQDTINRYLSAAASILGHDHVGIYGAYYAGKRALDAGVCTYMWQTEAWSGFGPPYNSPHVDCRANIVQRNRVGYQTIGGVQCDINEAHSIDFGQCLPPGVQPVTPVSLLPTVNAAKPGDEPTQIAQVWDQLCIQWPQLAGHTFVDGLSMVGQALGVTGMAPPPSASPMVKPLTQAAQASQVWDQLRIIWPQLASHTPVDGLALIGQKLGIPGFNPPK